MFLACAVMFDALAGTIANTALGAYYTQDFFDHEIRVIPGSIPLFFLANSRPWVTRTWTGSRVIESWSRTVFA
jgi:hypothetical protein